MAQHEERRPFSAQEKLDAVERELRFRRRVYPRRVDDGRMTKASADAQIALFEAIAEDYRALAAGERLL
jgi:hypothetical protein